MDEQLKYKKQPTRPRPQENRLIKICLFLICLIWTLPTLGILITSFRTRNATKTSGWWATLLDPLNSSQWTLENYHEVLRAGEMVTAFVNSVVTTIPATVISITVALFAAYAFAWMRFPGRQLLLATVVITMALPFHMAIIPLLRFYVHNDMLGTFHGIWLAHTTFSIPLAIYLFFNYFSHLPKEMFELARIDATNHYTAFVKFVLPLSIPATVSFTMFQFLWLWGDHLITRVFLGGQSIVTTRLADLVGSQGQDWHLLAAGTCLSMLLPLVVVLSLQRYFVRNFVIGSVN